MSYTNHHFLSKKRPVACFECGKYGHIVKDCWYVQGKRANSGSGKFPAIRNNVDKSKTVFGKQTSNCSKKNFHTYKIHGNNTVRKSNFRTAASCYYCGNFGHSMTNCHMMKVDDYAAKKLFRTSGRIIAGPKSVWVPVGSK